GEEVTRQQALRLGPQEPPPGGVQAARSRQVASGAEDPPHSRLADPVAKACQLAVHPAVPPGRVLPRQPQYKVRIPWPTPGGPAVLGRSTCEWSDGGARPAGFPG